jgi:hypothetical protein
MNRLCRILVITLGCAAAAPVLRDIAMIVVLMLSYSPPPERAVVYAPSPTGAYKAVVMERASSATTRTAHYVLVLRTEERREGRASPVSVRLPYHLPGDQFTGRDYREMARIGLRWVAADTLEASVD